MTAPSAISRPSSTSLSTLDRVGSFSPPFWLRAGRTQTILAGISKHWRSGGSAMRAASRPVVLDAGTGADGKPVRLLGHYSKCEAPRGLFIFYHGWEGSEKSHYVETTASRLFDAGYSTFRLCYRDHGDSHHLNEGLFFAPHFAEVLEATRKAATLVEGLPVYIIGYSLGGNYALRAASRNDTEAIRGLTRVFAISPVVEPLPAAPLVDRYPLIRRYFYKKFTGSLKKKQALYPDIYDFTPMLKSRSVMSVSDQVIPAYSQWRDRAAYFNAYRIAPNALENLRTPLTIITARDDPIIPPKYIDELQVSDNVERIVFDHGGHNGFFDSLSGPAWYERYIHAKIGASHG